MQLLRCSFTRCHLLALCLALALSACATLEPLSGVNDSNAAVPPLSGAGEVIEIGRFTSKRVGAPLPAYWKPYIIHPSKPLTQYSVVNTDCGAALQAVANASASGLYRTTRVDVQQHPLLAWRWRVDNDVEGADKRSASREDSPARLILTFHGDPANLDVGARAKLRLIRAITGRDLPYATLMYVWSNNEPVETILPNPHTDRIQMIVVSRGAETIGRWQVFERNVLEDFRRAFGEDPGQVLTVGVMSDADNTGDDAHALYGDIAFMKSAQ